MKDFERNLYEALLVAFGKTLAKHNAFAQGFILREIGKEIIDYLNENGLDFEERGDESDLGRLTRLFVANGFADELDIAPEKNGHNYIWRNLYGRNAYQRLHEICDNPFLACPLNLCLFYIAEKHGKTMVLHDKRFHADSDLVESHYEIIDKPPAASDEKDPLACENATLLELAEERARRLEKAQAEIRTLRGILPICSSCKKIRNENGEWQPVETYVRTHTNADFSHGYCPDCEADFMKDIEKTFGPEDPA